MWIPTGYDPKVDRRMAGVVNQTPDGEKRKCHKKRMKIVDKKDNGPVKIQYPSPNDAVHQASPKPVDKKDPPEPKVNENRGRKEKGNKKPEKSIVTKVKKKGKTVDYANKKKSSSQPFNQHPPETANKTDNETKHDLKELPDNKTARDH